MPIIIHDANTNNQDAIELSLIHREELGSILIKEQKPQLDVPLKRSI